MAQKEIYKETLYFDKTNADITEAHVNNLCYLLECIEKIESVFNIEFACSNGKYYSDLINCDETNKDGIEKYDGKIDFSIPIRCNITKKLINYATFKIVVIADRIVEEDAVAFLNNKKRSSFIFFSGNVYDIEYLT